VHRLLARAGLGGRPGRLSSKERRSFLVEHAGDLWLGDALHGPRVLWNRQKRKTYLLSQLDLATRYVVQSGFRLSEGAVDHERGLKQALLVHGRPRTYYVDLGAAYVADSLRAICGELAIHLLHTAPRDCEAKGAIERFHRTWREEVGDELPEEGLTLDELNQIHWAWLAREYHERVHSTTGRRPREHFLSEAPQLRPLPRGIDLEAVFWHRVSRHVRKDGTVQFGGKRLEVLAELVGRKVELRYDPTELEPRPRVFVEGQFVCDTTPLDLFRNAHRRRRRLGSATPEDATPTGLDPLGDLKQEHYHRVRGPKEED
jgi:transposase InsO family protein